MTQYFKIIKAIFLILVLIWISACSQINDDNSNFKIKEKLEYPFGTILKLKIEIIDGKDLEMKEFSGEYLIKIIEVNDNKVPEPQIMSFSDESGLFPSDNFELYKFLYGKETGNLSEDLIKKMNKNYVGKIFNVLAYESGNFSGSPVNSDYVTNHVSDFDLATQDISFQFVNFIKITTKLDYD